METENKTQNSKQNSKNKTTKWLIRAAVAGTIAFGSILGINSCDKEQPIVLEKPKPTLCELTAKIQEEAYSGKITKFDEKDVYNEDPTKHKKAYRNHPVQNFAENNSLEIYFPINDWTCQGNDIEDISNYLKSIDKSQDDITIYVEGRADKTGNKNANKFLGTKRADSINEIITNYAPKELKENIRIQNVVYGDTNQLPGNHQRNRSAKLVATSNPFQPALDKLVANDYVIDISGSMIEKVNGEKTRQDYVNELEFPRVKGEKVDYSLRNKLNIESTADEIKKVEDKITAAEKARIGNDSDIYGIKEANLACGGNLKDQVAEGKSPIYDNLMDVINSSEEHKTITLITDGYDNNSKFTQKQVMTAANKKHIKINLLHLTPSENTIEAKKSYGTLMELVNETSGKYVLYK